MPRQDLIQFRNGTLAELNTLTSGNFPEVGEPIAVLNSGNYDLYVGKGPTLAPSKVNVGGALSSSILLTTSDFTLSTYGLSSQGFNIKGLNILNTVQTSGG